MPTRLVKKSAPKAESLMTPARSLLRAWSKFWSDYYDDLFKMQHVAVRGHAGQMRDMVGHLIDRSRKLTGYGATAADVAHALVNDLQQQDRRITNLRARLNRRVTVETKQLRELVDTRRKIINAQRRQIRKWRKQCEDLIFELGLTGPLIDPDMIGKPPWLSDLIYLADKKNGAIKKSGSVEEKQTKCRHS